MRAHGRVRVSSSRPEAYGHCDRCGFVYNHSDLKWQYDWRGTEMVNLNLLVCDRCLDVPAPFMKTIILPPDPLPIMNARPGDKTTQQTIYRITEEEDRRITEDDDDRITESNP